MSDKTLQMPRPIEVLDAIEEWRSLDLREATISDIIASMAALRDKLQFAIVQRLESSPPKLWRVRRRDFAESFDSLSDFWEPPAEEARLNRCNPAGQPILYCSKDLATALDESRIENGDELLLVKYRATSRLRLSRVVGTFDPNPMTGAPALDDSGLLAYRIMREFLRAEFTKPVGIGTEALYKVSVAVCQVWAASDSDGWIYPSIRSPLEGNENLAIAPAPARTKLAVKSGHWCVAQDVRAPLPAAVPLGQKLPGIRLRHLFIADVGQDRVSWRQPTALDKVPNFAVRK